jgi:hypothetical protein
MIMGAMMKRRVLIAVFGLLLALAPVIDWYAAMGLARDHVMRTFDVPRGGRNALLHSVAGAETYIAFRRLGFGKERALRSTEWLGYCNEWFEHATKRLDHTAEVYKDLHNNLYGIVVAAWLKEVGIGNTLGNRMGVLAWLVRERHMPWWPSDIDTGLPHDQFETAPAMRLYEANRTELRNQMAVLLNERLYDILVSLPLPAPKLP